MKHNRSFIIAAFATAAFAILCASAPAQEADFHQRARREFDRGRWLAFAASDAVSEGRLERGLLAAQDARDAFARVRYYAHRAQLEDIGTEEAKVLRRLVAQYERDLDEVDARITAQKKKLPVEAAPAPEKVPVPDPVKKPLPLEIPSHDPQKDPGKEPDKDDAKPLDQPKVRSGVLWASFQSDLEGWTLTGGSATADRGYIRAADTAHDEMVLTAPETFCGDLSAYNGGTLLFRAIELGNPHSSWGSFGTVYLICTKGNVTLDIAPDALPREWSTYSIPLTAKAWDMDEVRWPTLLADVTAIRLNIESGSDVSETVGMDDFRLLPKGTISSEERQRAQETATAIDLVRRMARIFRKIDADGNGHLFEEEIDRALLDPSFKGADAATLMVLKRSREQLEELADDETGDENKGPTMEDVRKFLRWVAEGPDGSGSAVVNSYEYYRRKITQTSRNPFPTGKVDPLAVAQGSIGDCFWVAAQMGAATHDPDSVRAQIEALPDGRFRISAPGLKPRVIDAPTDGEIAYYSGAGENGLWLTLLAKSFGESVDDEAFFESEIPSDSIDGGQLQEGIEAVTGHNSDVDTLSLTLESVTRTKLAQAMADGRLVTVGIGRGMPWSDTTSNGLPTSHAFTVTGYDPAAKMVTLRNPWGLGEPVGRDGFARDGRDDGVFVLSAEEFDSTFSHIAYEEK